MSSRGKYRRHAQEFKTLGKVSGWTWAGGVVNTRTYDAYGRISTYFLGNPLGSGVASGLQRTVTYDAAGKPIAFAHTNSIGAQTAFDHAYAFDGRSRVINAAIAGTSNGYDYDQTNNRTDLVVCGSDLVLQLLGSISAPPIPITVPQTGLF